MPSLGPAGRVAWLTVRAVKITSFGGPEVLELTEVPDPAPAPGQELIAVTSAGINFADTHQTEDSYLSRQHLPFVPGSEVVGRIRGGARDGERVVALVQGGYAELAVAPSAGCLPVPEDVDDATALGLVLQGTTAWHLLRTSARMETGESVVVHAAAGGVGSLAVQLAHQWGAGRVIATASSPAKRDLALSLGADVAVDVSRLESAQAVRDALRAANDGAGVDVVLEMTGGVVLDGSLAALGRFGRLVSYGMASRTEPSPVAPQSLMRGSRSLVGFWLVDMMARPDPLGPALEEMFSLVRTHRLRVVLGGRYPLDEVARAHRDLLSRTTTGKLVLDVGAGR